MFASLKIIIRQKSSRVSKFIVSLKNVHEFRKLFVNSKMILNFKIFLFLKNVPSFFQKMLMTYKKCSRV